MILLFLSALAVGFSGAMMPGSLLTYTIRQSLSIGPRAGFIITAGHAVLELVLIALIFLGFGVILQSAAAQISIGLIGGLLLIYLGIDMIRSSIKNKISIQVETGASKAGSLFLSGIVISATNPYFLIWWAVVGLGFVMESYNSYGIIGVVVYFVGHIFADFIWYDVVSIAVGTTRRFIKHKPYRIIIAVLGCILLFFGGRFVYGAVSSVL